MAKKNFEGAGSGVACDERICKSNWEALAIGISVGVRDRRAGVVGVRWTLNCGTVEEELVLIFLVENFRSYIFGRIFKLVHNFNCYGVCNAVGQVDRVDNRATVVFWVSPACYETGAVVSSEGKLNGGHYLVQVMVMAVMVIVVAMVVVVMVVVVMVIMAYVVATSCEEPHRD